MRRTLVALIALSALFVTVGIAMPRRVAPPRR